MKSRQPSHPAEENDCRQPALLPPPSLAKAPTHTCLPTQPVHSSFAQPCSPGSLPLFHHRPSSNLLYSRHPVTLTPGWRGYLPQPPASCSSQPLLLRSLPPDTAELPWTPPSPTPEKKTYPLFCVAGRILWYDYLMDLAKALRNSNADSLQRNAPFTAPPAAQKHPFAAPRAPPRAGSSLDPSARSSAPPSHLSPPPLLTQERRGAAPYLASLTSGTTQAARSGAARTCCRRLLGSGCREGGASGEQVWEVEIKSEGR